MPDQLLPYTKTFTDTGVSDAFRVKGKFPVSLIFGSGAVQIERSIDNNKTYQPLMGPAGTPASFTASTSFEVDETADTWYRFNCTGYASDITCKAGY